MYEEDPSMEERVKCDIEIDCANGAALAWLLRKIADQVEGEELDDGHHDLIVPDGDKVGEVYLDYYAVETN